MSKEEVKEIIDTISKEEFPYALAIAKAYEKLEQENTDLRIQVSAREEEYRKLEDNWNELKKWLKDYLKLFNNPDYFEEQSIEDLNEVLNKMQELEKGKSE